MSRTQWQLWFSEAETELKDWSKRSLLLWAACLLGALLFVFLAFSAAGNTRNLLLNIVEDAAASNTTNTTNTRTDASGRPGEPQELVLVDVLAQPDDQQLKQLSETALTLHSRLQSGSESEASYASNAGRVAGLAVAMRQSQLANSEASFWRPVSEAIAALENGVRLGDIASGSAVGFITEMRARYVALRTGSSVSSSASRGTSAAGVSAAITGAVTDSDAVSDPRADASAPAGVSAPSTSSTASLPWSLQALPWLSLLLPTGCLAVGFQVLRLRVQRRHEARPKAGYAAVAGARQAQAMTATPVQENRHAAERKTQAAILQLLDEMEPLSEGDLTHEASVTEDLTGALADSFNHAVHELRRLVKQINRSTTMVRAAVSESRERTLSMARQGAVQAREVSRTNERIDNMQSDVVSLSQTSRQVAEYAQKVARRTQLAAESVADTCDALRTMRERSDVAEQSMRRLVNSTKGIELRLADIKSAARRTDLLAINSTIHAASLPAALSAGPAVSSGEWTHDSSGVRSDGTSGVSSGQSETFSELATDVSSLAEQLMNATNDIDQLSVIIRDEASESLGAINDTGAQLKHCEALGHQARQHLGNIARAAQALGEAVNEISERTRVQAQGITDIASTTSVINTITRDTATALTQAVKDLQSLENMSNSLEASVHGFRLPGEHTS